MQKVPEFEKSEGFWKETLAWVAQFVQSGRPKSMVLELEEFRITKLAVISKILLMTEDLPKSLLILTGKLQSEHKPKMIKRIPTDVSSEIRVNAEIFIDNALSEFMVKKKVKSWEYQDDKFESYFGKYVYQWKVNDLFTFIQKDRKRIDNRNIDLKEGVINKIKDEKQPDKEKVRLKYLELFSIFLIVVEEKTGKNLLKRNPHRILFHLYGSLFLFKSANIDWRGFYSENHKKMLGELFDKIAAVKFKGRMAEYLTVMDHSVLSKPTRHVYNRNYQEEVTLRQYAGPDTLVRELKVYFFFLKYYADNPVEFDITGIVGILSKWRNEIKSLGKDLFTNPHTRFFLCREHFKEEDETSNPDD